MKNISLLAEIVGSELSSRQMKITTAESCTGGGVAYWLTSIPGSSQWFDRGFVTYSNAAKMTQLNISEKTLQQFGSVSEETAREMAEGALSHSDADVSIAITGIAGPDGGSKIKPVGTVWIAYAGKNLATNAFVSVFPGDRQAIREQTIQTALVHLLKYLNH